MTASTIDPRVLPADGRFALLARRAAFWGPVLLLPGLGAWLAAVATAGAPGLLRWPLLVLLWANLLYFALTGWPGVLGILARLVSGAPRAVPATISGASRTALLMPIYNEETRPVFTAVEVMARAIVDRGLPGVDLFVLSDTRDPVLALDEAAAYAALSARLPPGVQVRYRRREENARRKAGNIAAFCDQWGDDYDYMVVLDADSLMSAEAIGTLIGLMDANPRAGIIQTIPFSVGRDTLFARMQQFAARLYAPIMVEGMVFWQRRDGNYWGHNAIVRVAPFARHCELPVLPGREPFGGEILCHDVVEAGLMRRAGLEVWIVPQSLDSFEALPANLVDFAVRERRWCQGNLQHLGVLGMPGLPTVARYHLGMGVMHYVSGPVAALFILLAMLDAAWGGGFLHGLISAGPASVGLLALFAGLLYAAKLLILGSALADPAESAQYGGRLRLLASAALEQLGCFVTAPVLLVAYVRYIAAMLLGIAVGWDAQPRDDRGLSWREAWGMLRLQTLFGAGWGLYLAVMDPVLLSWALPLVGGLLLAVPAAVWSSRTSLGQGARRAGLFLTVDETSPSPVLRALQRAMGRRPVNREEVSQANAVGTLSLGTGDPR